jgi:hypothetical protein
MKREYIKIDGVTIRQPDEGLGYDFETTYTSDSTRVQSGVGHFSPMYTVESFSYEASYVAQQDVKTILQLVMGKASFTLHYFSPYYGCWRDDKFYVGKGSMSIGSLVDGEFVMAELKGTSKAVFESLSFNMIGINPIGGGSS